MVQNSRVCLAATVLTLAALIMGASAGLDGIDKQKQDVVRASLGSLGRADAGGALLEAATRAEALLDIQVDAQPEHPVVTLKATGAPEWRAFAIENEQKIVIDLTNTVNLVSGKVFPAPGASAVRQVRSSLFTLAPAIVSRIVIDLTASSAFEVSRDAGTIAVTLTPKSPAPKPPAAPAPKAPKPPEPVIVAADPSVETDREVASLCASIDSLRRADEIDAAITLLNDYAAQGYRTRAAAEEAPPAPQSHTAVIARASELREAFREAGSLVLSRSLQGYEALARQQADTPAPADDAVQERITQLTETLEAVQASQLDMTGEPLMTFAAVADEPPPPPDPGDAKPNAEPEKDAQKPADKPPAKDEAAESTTPPPPEKRSAQQTPAAPGPPVVTRMQQVVSGGGAPNPAAPGVTAAQAVPPAQEPGHKAPEPEEPPIVGNPLDQIINVDFREMDITNVVALLAQKARINVIAGADLTGVVTASLRNVTLGKAMDTVLRMNGLGMVEEEGIFRIVPYEEAMAAKRTTIMITLESAKSKDLKKTLEDVLKGSPDDTLTTISDNEATNVLIIAGPKTRVAELERLVKDLDIAKPVTPTVTEALKINNAEPKELQDLIKSMLSPEIGKVAIDERSRHVVVTDIPVVLEQVRDLLTQVDQPVKQVSIDTMIIDAVLTDASETGVDWILKSVRDQNRWGQPIGSLTGPVMGVDATGDIIQRDIISDMTRFGTGSLVMGLLTSNFDLKAAIGAQVTNRHAKLLANPIVVTVENKKATINISEEIPYQESKQSLTGPPMVSTAFKDIGIILEVTPQVSHDDHVISQIMAKQSHQNGTFNAIPIEAKRTTDTTLRSKSGQTIFIGGLRRFDDTKQADKVPILGDIPVLNFMFRHNTINKQTTELLVFLTCTVLPDEMPELGSELQNAHNELEHTPKTPNIDRDLGRMFTHPRTIEDPTWKWRRSE